MNRAFTFVVSLIALSGAALAGAACAQPPPPIPLAISALPARGEAKLVVSSPAFKDGLTIPLANTAYGENAFPGLAWSGAPNATMSFAVIMQDVDPPAQFAWIQTILHWTEFNIPAARSQLEANVSQAAVDASFGANWTDKAAPYVGPHPPASGPVHHYHFQVFALDCRLPLADGAKFTDLAAAMKDHVLASGEVVGTYQGPAAPAP